MLDTIFHLKESGSDFKTELSGALVCFASMCYILFVQAGMFTTLGVSFNAIYIATALATFIGCFLTGLIANLPLAQSCGMGMNAFFVYTVCLGFGLSYQNALALVLIEGVVFVLLTVSGLRSKLFGAIPQSVRVAIPCGIGLFITYIALQNSGIIINNASTCSSLVSLNVLNGVTWSTIMPILVTCITVVGIGILYTKQIKGAILFGLLGGSVIYYLLGLTIPEFYANMSFTLNPFSAFADFGREAFWQVFKSGFDFSEYIVAHGAGNFTIMLITTALSMMLLDIYDTASTLYGACACGNMLKDGEVPNFEKAMLADATATVTGSVCGVSTVTHFVESAAAVAEGARTGLAACLTGVLFLIASILSPIASLIPTSVTSAVLIIVGILMMANITQIDWKDFSVSIPAFLSIVITVLSYSISYGIAAGMISYTLLKVLNGKFKEVNISTYVISALFAVMFFLTH